MNDNATILHKDTAYCIVNEDGERLFCDTPAQAIQIAASDFMAFIYRGAEPLYAVHNDVFYPLAHGRSIEQMLAAIEARTHKPRKAQDTLAVDLGSADEF